MIKEVLADAEARMKSTLHILEEDLRGMRTGRASTGLVEKLHIDYYGTETPLYQLATLSADVQTILIRPFDRNTLGIIERAIQQSDLGLNPNNDGTSIRLNLPPLTEERRRDLVKQMHKKLEESKVSIRNIRRSAIDDLRDIEKEKMASEDECKQGQEDVQKLTDKYIHEIDDIGKRKEKEIMEI